MNPPPSAAEPSLSRAALRTPRAAAVAGIVFAVLFATSMVMVRTALPESLEAVGVSTSTQTNARMVSLALTLVPFAGIAFLWFMGVVRDRLGKREDQLFSTVFFGSGLLFLAMIFVAAGVAGGLMLTLEWNPAAAIATGAYTFGRAVISVVMSVYAIRMAGVLMLSLGTLWMRTRGMPRLAVFATYGLALLMLLTISLAWWLILLFPAWVLGISVYILVESGRGKSEEAEEILGGISD